MEDAALLPRPRHYRSSAPASNSRTSSGCRVEWLALVASGGRARARPPSAPERSSRGFTGQGPGSFRLPGAFRRDCSPRKLRPDPIGSDTCRREARRERRLERPTPLGTHVLACAHDEPTGRTCLREAHQTPAFQRTPRRPGQAHEAHPVSRASSRARLRRRPLSRPSTDARAASHAAPRRETRSAAPEVPFIDVRPHSRQGFHPASIRGWAAFHKLSPTCGLLAAGAFAFLT